MTTTPKPRRRDVANRIIGVSAQLNEISPTDRGDAAQWTNLGVADAQRIPDRADPGDRAHGDR